MAALAGRPVIRRIAHYPQDIFDGLRTLLEINTIFRRQILLELSPGRQKFVVFNVELCYYRVAKQANVSNCKRRQDILEREIIFDPTKVPGNTRCQLYIRRTDTAAVLKWSMFPNQQ